jgi:hypothetical protein
LGEQCLVSRVACELLHVDNRVFRAEGRRRQP